jgi:hypothetical protein
VKIKNYNFSNVLSFFLSIPYLNYSISYTDHDSIIKWQDLHANKFSFGGGGGARISSNRGRIGWTAFFKGIRIESIPGDKLI